MKGPATRREIHYGNRVVRAYADRPRNIDAMLRDTAARLPNADALLLGGERMSYAQLDAAVGRVAGGLLAAGLRPGDRLAILLGNDFEFVLAVLGAARAGLISVPLNTRQRRPEIEFVLNQCGAAGIVYAGEHAANLPAAADVPSLRSVFVVGEGPGRPFAALADAAPAADLPDVAEDSPFCLLYTSGTTGRPKGAVLTHFGVVHSLIHYREGLRLREGDVAALAVPASHVTGLVAIVLAMILAGGATAIMPAFKARTYLEMVARDRVTYALLVPAMYNLCLLDPELARFDLSSWRVGGFGGAPMPQATIDRLAAEIPGLSLVNVYGATETTSPATILPIGDIAIRPASVGKTVACGEIVAVDEDGREVAPGETGELLIAGPMVVPGYWDNPEADRASFADGYWRSGDIGSIDAEGYVHVLDRKKDMVNRGGFKVYCVEVESVLSLHPGVVESAVVGRPDPVLGEKVHAFVHTGGREADAAMLRAHCAERLSDYKVPDGFTFLDEPLPRNANGKVLKTALRDLLKA